MTITAKTPSTRGTTRRLSADRIGQTTNVYGYLPAHTPLPTSKSRSERSTGTFLSPLWGDERKQIM